MPLELFLVPVQVFEADQLQDAARVGDVVGRIQDPGGVQPVGVLGLGELVVRAAGDRVAAQARDRVGVEDAADRARGIDVALRADHVVDRDQLRARRRRPRIVDVGDENVRVVGEQQAHEIGTDCAGALHENRSSRQVGRSERVLGGGTDRV